MKALVYTGIGELALENVPEPATEFVVKVLGCGICGTDLKTYQKGHHLFPPPAVLGHEFIGEVERAPASSGYSPGDKVVIAPYAECGVCDVCARGAGSLCAHKQFIEGGAFCERVGIPEDYIGRGVFRLGEEDDVYTLVEPLACVLNGVEQLSLKASSKVLVVGAGPMGVLFALLFQAKGIPVAMVEPAPARRTRVASWGIKTLEPGQIPAGVFDTIIIAVNKKELFSEYVLLTADAGTVLMFSGLSKDEYVSIEAYSIHYRQIALKGSFGYAIHHFCEALWMIRGHKQLFSKVITHRFPLERGKEAFDLAASGEALKVVLRP